MVKKSCLGDSYVVQEFRDGMYLPVYRGCAVVSAKQRSDAVKLMRGIEDAK